jgi:hypothetical protein
MHPLLGSFIRLTLIIVVGLIALKIAFVLIGLLIPAVILAAVVVGGLFLYNMFRRRAAVPVIRQ